ncbi:hypothetical protein Ccrd_021897 [Cynara cardunculus var. scolymus]|uniref:Uncharacterized protein n=1 Tax=Cynara cardunculus var. scolymus TaxID=59895 RepID=A0A103XZP8_CYNCS|nr:hypothetical protein Ccrd_021897 [Cynara cardunculus var. scolymus]
MKSTAEAMPWVGLYVAVASLICTLAMAADVFQGFRQRKLWFPCKFFTLNAASITLIAIAMKLPVDLTTNISNDDAFIYPNWSIRSTSIYFLLTMLANFLPSLGGMDDKELFTNIIALGILIITIIVNMFIQLAVIHDFLKLYVIDMSIITIFLLWPFWVAFTVPASTRILEYQYEEMHRSTLDCQEIKFSPKELTHYVKKYWMIAETGNPQFVIASSPICSASGFKEEPNASNNNARSEIKEYIGYALQIEEEAKLSKRMLKNMLKSITKLLYQSEKKQPRNLVKFLEKSTGFNGVAEFDNDQVPPLHPEETNNCWSLIAITLTAVALALPNIENGQVKGFKASNSNTRSEIEEYTSYVLQIEEEAKLSNRMLRNILGSIAKLVHESEKKQPRYLLKFLEKSIGFNGVIERVIQHQYQELHRSVLDCQEIKFSSKELTHHVKKYWMIAETGNPQFVLASSPFCSASGLVCSIIAAQSILSLIGMLEYTPHFWDGKSDYKWSINVILTIQYVRMVVGSIAPTFRCITTTTYFNLSKEWSINHINMFRVEKHWTQRLRHWKRNHYTSHIPGRHCKKVFNHVKNMILNLCIALQMTLVVICKTICLVPTCIMLLFCSCCHFCNSLLKRFREEPNASNNNARSEIKEYIGYALQIEEEAKLSKRMLKNMLKSITKLLYQSEKKQPRNLVKFLEKPTGFNGVAEFDNDQVPPLHPEETNNCWSLIAITLTAVALALPNIENGQVKGLLASMSEGLQFVTHIEETLDANGDLVKARKTARRVWTEVEVYCSWLHIDLQMKAHKGKMSQEILQWLSDEAIQIVIHSMYRISQTILLHCNEQEDWPTDVELFEWITTIIADLLCACFTNLPRVITLKCHHDAIEKREESIRTAAQLLGKSKTILNILEGRQLPDLDQESMAYIDKWQALPKSQVFLRNFEDASSFR